MYVLFYRSASLMQRSSSRKIAITDIATYIPLRLSEGERKLLVVLENALEVCEYTDVVDVTFSHTRKSKQSRIIESLIDTLSISCGLMVWSYPMIVISYFDVLYDYS